MPAKTVLFAKLTLAEEKQISKEWIVHFFGDF